MIAAEWGFCVDGFGDFIGLVVMTLLTMGFYLTGWVNGRTDLLRQQRRRVRSTAEEEREAMRACAEAMREERGGQESGQ